MLVVCILTIYILLILYPYGQGLFFLFSAKQKKQADVSLALILLVGLMVVTTLASFASLVIRINWEFQVALVIGAALLYIFVLVPHRLFPKISLKNLNLAQKIGLVFLAVSLVIFLYQASLTPANADTGIYHAQAIHWIETYPAVPGLGNLHNRLAYDSSWLVAVAVFSFSFLGGQSFHVLPAVLFFISLVYFYQGINELLAGKFKLSNFLKLGFFLSCFIFIFDQVSSPGTDVPITLLIWFIVSLIVEWIEKKRLIDHDIEVLLLFLLCFFGITLKVSSFPVLILPLVWWVYLLIKKNGRLAWKAALSAVVIILPFVSRNLILSGYPVYPGFPIDLFHFDWAIPLDSVRSESTIIHWFATLPSVQLEDFLNMSLKDQTINWFANQLPRHKAILLCIPLGLGVNLLLYVFKAWREEFKQNWEIIFVYLAVLAGCIFWFFTAPAMRFGYGFLLAAVFLLVFPPIVFLLPRLRWLQRISGWLILIGSVGLVGVMLHSSLKVSNFAQTLIIPADYPGWSSEPCTFGNFDLLCQAGYDSCWYSPFPCAIRGNDSLEMRGDDYRDGFRIVQ